MYYQLLLRFDFQIIDPQKPFGGICVGFFMHDNMLLRVEERK